MHTPTEQFDVVKIVRTILGIAEVELPLTNIPLNHSTIKNNVFFSININQLENKPYRVRILVVFNINPPHNSLDKYETTKETQYYTLWGDLETDFAEFIPDDLTYYYFDDNGRKVIANFWGLWDKPQTTKFLENWQERLEYLVKSNEARIEPPFKITEARLKSAQ